MTVGAPTEFDLFVIGGGVNGCGIARDAAGRGLRTGLAEMGDLGGATSSASTKLFHGGLRYLEHGELRLVREALRERETLLDAMPHISWPMRFVLPHHPGLRPAWLLRLGLFAYDHLGGRRSLPPSRSLDLRRDPAGVPLSDAFTRAFEYSDGWVMDSRLVVLNARDAAARGAVIAPRTRCTGARREAGRWRIGLEDAAGPREVTARALVNAAGPWVNAVLGDVLGVAPPAPVRLVRGSHVVTRRWFEGERAYVFQGADRRIVFAIPYESDFTLIGTTDRDHAAPLDAPVTCSDEERDYLCAAASRYFRDPVRPGDVVWSFAGVRPLFDDGTGAASAATRDYRLHLAAEAGQAPLLSVYGGKITTYRRLAEAALAKLAPHLPAAGPAWTAGAPLPGGDFLRAEVAQRVGALIAAYPFLDAGWAWRLFRAYGTEAGGILGAARAPADLGRRFGHDLTEAEVAWLMDREWARSAEDVLWRRSKLGLRLSGAEAADLAAWMAARHEIGTRAGAVP